MTKEELDNHIYVQIKIIKKSIEFLINKNDKISINKLKYEENNLQKMKEKYPEYFI